MGGTRFLQAFYLHAMTTYYHDPIHTNGLESVARNIKYIQHPCYYAGCGIHRLMNIFEWLKSVTSWKLSKKYVRSFSNVGNECVDIVIFAHNTILIILDRGAIITSTTPGIAILPPKKHRERRKSFPQWRGGEDRGR